MESRDQFVVIRAGISNGLGTTLLDPLSANTRTTLLETLEPVCWNGSDQETVEPLCSITLEPGNTRTTLLETLQPLCWIPLC